jgi:hypothetical protein
MANSVFPVASSSGYPSGTTAQRPSSPTAGSLYYDTTVGGLLIFNGVSWNTFILPPTIIPPTSPVATNIGTGRSYNNGAASIAFNPSSELGGFASLYTVTSSPGSYVGTGTSSPITVTGLQSSVQYTYSIVASNSYGSANVSSSSAGVTATTVPQAPNVGAVANVAAAGGQTISVAFTPNATGGSSITGYTVISNPGNITAAATSGATSVNVTGLTNGTSYTFTVTATNANGTSLPSSASSSVTPSAPPPVVGGSVTSDATYYYRTFTSSQNLVLWQDLTFDYILVGGGGGGTGSAGTGGLGGATVYNTNLTKNSGTYAVVIGGGGGCGGGGGTSTALGLSASGGGGSGGYGGGGYTWLNGSTYGRNGLAQSQTNSVATGSAGASGSGNGGNGGWYNCDVGGGGSGTFIMRYTKSQVGG